MDRDGEGGFSPQSSHWIPRKHLSRVLLHDWHRSIAVHLDTSSPCGGSGGQSAATGCSFAILDIIVRPNREAWGTQHGGRPNNTACSGLLVLGPLGPWHCRCCEVG
eukprot:scaffold132525_cov69-Phaeocystis_antarctica.AAC.2